MLQFTRALAADWAVQRITVNAILRFAFVAVSEIAGTAFKQSKSN